MRACGANILAPGLPSPLPSPPASLPGDWPHWEVVSSYSSATASGFHGIPRIHTHRTKSRKELGRFGCENQAMSRGEETPNWKLILSDLIFDFRAAKPNPRPRRSSNEPIQKTRTDRAAWGSRPEPDRIAYIQQAVGAFLLDGLVVGLVPELHGLVHVCHYRLIQPRAWRRRGMRMEKGPGRPRLTEMRTPRVMAMRRAQESESAWVAAQ